MNQLPREMGKTARRNHQLCSTNPFPFGTEDYLEWNEGWSHANAYAREYDAVMLKLCVFTWELRMSETTKHNPKPKRKRLASCSLRFLLLTMSVIAIGFGLFNHYKAERRAIEMFKPERIYYDFNIVGPDDIEWDSDPEGPKWIRDWMKDDLFFARAKRVGLFYDDNAEAELAVEIKELNGIGALKQLEFLRVSSTGLESVEGISGLQQLLELHIDGAKSNCDLSPIGELRKLSTLSLRAKRGDEVTFSLTPFQNHPSLESASFLTWGSDPFKLEDVATLKTLPKLEKLSFNSCDFSTELPTTGTGNDKSQFPNLQELEIKNNDRMKSLGTLSVAPQLRSLSLIHCEQVDLSDPGIELPRLESIQVAKCDSLVTIDGLANSLAIKKALISSCPKLKSLEGLGAATELEQFNLYHCQSVENLDGLRNNQKLSGIGISGCQRLEDITGLGAAKNLESLSLSDVSLKSIDGLQAGQLTYCSVRKSDQLKSMGPLREAKNLETLVFERCQQIKELELHPEAKLRKMQLHCDFSLASLKRSFRGADALTRCTLRGCSEVENLDLFGTCAALESLSVRELDNLTQLANSNMKPLANLRILEIAHCPQLTSLEGIENFKQVRELEIANCEQLSDASQLSQLEGIEILKIDNCTKLIDCSFVRHLKDKSKILCVCFDKTSIPIESLAQLAKETSIEIIIDGRSSKYFKLE